jgi:ribose transport system permease protein
MENLRTRLLRSENAGISAIVLFGVILLALLKPAFLSELNIYVVLTSLALWTCVGLAQMTTMAIGQMSLSVGSLGGLAAVTVGGLCEVYGLPVPVAIGFALLVGLAGGALNGILISLSGVNSFIVTLATFSAFHGATQAVTHAVPFYKMPPDLVALGNARLGAIPLMLGSSLLAAAVLYIVFNHSRIGRHMLAFGGNPQAARLSGLSTHRVIITAHAISGVLAAIAAVLTVGRLQVAQPSIGEDWLIVSFAAPIIGGAVLSGGHVSVFGTLAALVILALINNALVLLGIDPFWVQLILGLLILAVVAANRMREGRRLGEPVAR